MSYDCFCDYDQPVFYRKTVRTARKEHRCSECGKAVLAGEKYEHAASMWDGRFDSYNTCARCMALRDHLAAHVRCFCWGHGSLLDDVRNEVENLPHEAVGSGLLFEIGRMAVAIRRGPTLK